MSTIIVERSSVKKGYLLERPMPEGPTHRVPYDCYNAVHRAAISEWNSQNSPFLKLPAELKNRIYEEALTGHILHIFERPVSAKEVQASSWKGRYCRAERPKSSSDEFSELTHTICQEPFVDEVCLVPRNFDSPSQRNMEEDRVALLKSSSAVSYGKSIAAEARVEHFYGCEQNGICAGNLTVMHRALKDFEMPEYPDTIRRMFRRTQLPLYFLRVCREVWTDAQILPFSGNTFSFNSAEAMRLFVKRMDSTARLFAIRSIRVTSDGIRDHICTSSRFPFLTDLKANLSFKNDWSRDVIRLEAFLDRPVRHLSIAGGLWD